MDKFWEFKDLSDTEAELLLYGEIASQAPWWDEGDTVTPKKFADELKKLSNKTGITVRINSGGGDVFAAHAIFTQLKLHQATITAIVDGIAASAATIVAMAGDTIKIPTNAMMMIHNPMAVLIGMYNTDALEKVSARLDQVKESIINAYITKTGLDRKALSKMMDNETWMTGEQAVEKGFADEVLFQDVQAAINGNMLVVNSISHDLSKFKNMPTVVNAGAPAGFNNSKQEPAQPKPAVKKEEAKLEIKNVDELRQHFPDLVAQVEASAKDGATKAERLRIQAIDEIGKTVSPELVNKAKYDEPMTAQDLAFAALKADAGKGRQYLEDVSNDNGGSGVKGVSGQPGGPKPEKEKEMEERKNNAQAIADFANKRRSK